MPGEKINGNDVLAVREATASAVARARAGEGPTFLENVTYRLKGHYEGDPQKYRTTEEIEIWRQKDPIEHFGRMLAQKKYLTKKHAAQIREAVQAELSEALAFAQNSPFPEPGDAMADLYSNP